MSDIVDMQEKWRAKKKITGGKGDIPKGTLLLLEERGPKRMSFRRAMMLPVGEGVQNFIIMHLPPLWDEFLERVEDKGTGG